MTSLDPRVAAALAALVVAAAFALAIALVSRARRRAASRRAVVRARRALAGETAAEALLISAGYRLLDAGPNFEAPVQITNELSRPLYAAIFGGYAVICLLIGTFLLYRRDGD